MKNQIDIQVFLEKYYGENDSVILGCSGGPDSMYLAYQILETSYSKNLVICYFNHKTRAQTDEEEAYLEKLALSKGCRFETAECDFEKIKKLYPSKSFEELAREKRYQFFDAIMNIYNSKYVLTGHHLDDRIETCLFNMLRGSKLTGLINMTNPLPNPQLQQKPLPHPPLPGEGKTPSESPSIEGKVRGGILRPLLDLEKSDILEYLDGNKLKYFIDETNTDTDITRNKMRHEILPKFAEIHPNHKNNIKNLLEYFEELKENIDMQVETFFSLSSQKSSGVKYFCVSDFLNLSPLLQKEVIREIFYRTNANSTIGLSESNIAEVLRFISSPNGNTVKEIKDMKLYKKNGKIHF